MYRHLADGVPKAEAMQRTRQDFIRGDIRLVGHQLIGADGVSLLSELTASQQRRIRNGLANPFYWAGISLMGAPW